jgi:hypothetical protein
VGGQQQPKPEPKYAEPQTSMVPLFQAAQPMPEQVSFGQGIGQATGIGINGQGQGGFNPLFGQQQEYNLPKAQSALMPKAEPYKQLNPLLADPGTGPRDPAYWNFANQQGSLGAKGVNKMPFVFSDYVALGNQGVPDAAVGGEGDGSAEKKAEGNPLLDVNRWVNDYLARVGMNPEQYRNKPGLPGFDPQQAYANWYAGHNGQPLPHEGYKGPGYGDQLLMDNAEKQAMEALRAQRAI